MTLFKNHLDIQSAEDLKWYCENVLDEMVQDMLGNPDFTFELDPELETDQALIEAGAMYIIRRRGMTLLENLQGRYDQIQMKAFKKEDWESINISGIIEE